MESQTERERCVDREAEDELRASAFVFSFIPSLSALFSLSLFEPVCVKLMAAKLTMDQTHSVFVLKMKETEPSKLTNDVIN